MDYYVVDVFTDRLFKGNPAGVCVLENPLDDAVMQSIAAENNLSETAFLIKRTGGYGLRWFTPSIEVDLCGHATIASAFVLFRFYEKFLDEISFDTADGIMRVTRSDDMLYLDFPARKAAPAANYKTFERAFSRGNSGVLKAVDFMVLFESEADIRGIVPDLAALTDIKREAAWITTASALL